MAVFELTEDELDIVRTALHAYLDTFGHDESEVRHRIRAVLDRLPGAGSAARPAS